jgi:hypothetical protein
MDTIFSLGWTRCQLILEFMDTAPKKNPSPFTSKQSGAAKKTAEVETNPKLSAQELVLRYLKVHKMIPFG